jgi:hypothetical protein
MLRIPIREIEEALRNPSAYRQKLLLSATVSYGPTYFGALRDAILQFHKTNGNIVQARAYLRVRLDRFLDRMRCAETMDQFEWYTDEYQNRGWPTFETRLRIVISLPPRVRPYLFCSGEVSRVDLVPVGGYAAWLTRSRGAKDWARELRMPLVQQALAQGPLGVPPNEVMIGIYSFEEQFTDLRRYSQAEIDQANSELDNLLRRMGF